MTLTSEEIQNWPVIVGKMGKPDECGFRHHPAQRVFVRKLEGGIIEQSPLGIYCLDCGIRLEEISE